MEHTHDFQKMVTTSANPTDANKENKGSALSVPKALARIAG
jgi:hypothetical protein